MGKSDRAAGGRSLHRLVRPFGSHRAEDYRALR